MNEESEGIFVRQITPDSPIARDGRVKPGDRLLVANSEWVMSLEPQELAEVRSLSLNFILPCSLIFRCSIRRRAP